MFVIFIDFEITTLINSVGWIGDGAPGTNWCQNFGIAKFRPIRVIKV